MIKMKSLQNQNEYQIQNKDQLLGYNPNQVEKIKYFRLVRRSAINLFICLVFYLDIGSDINLIIQYYMLDNLPRVIATCIVLSFPTLFMIIFFCSREILYSKNTTSKMVRNCLIYITIFVAQLHILFR